MVSTHYSNFYFIKLLIELYGFSGSGKYFYFGIKELFDIL